jgi:hypothetical protein
VLKLVKIRFENNQFNVKDAENFGISKFYKKFILKVGYCFLIFFCIFKACLLVLFRNTRNEKIQIRVNLLCSLAAAQTVFLVGIDKTDNKGICVFVAAIINLFYLVSFCWMLMEGVYLYQMVVKVFDAHLRMRYSYAFAYGKS